MATFFNTTDRKPLASEQSPSQTSASKWQDGSNQTLLALSELIDQASKSIDVLVRVQEIQQTAKATADASAAEQATPTSFSPR